MAKRRQYTYTDTRTTPKNMQFSFENRHTATVIAATLHIRSFEWSNRKWNYEANQRIKVTRKKRRSRRRNNITYVWIFILTIHIQRD